jgi:hypothetical protein
MLISIGVEYTVAVYNTDTQTANNAQLGKLVASSQGPKGSVFHVCPLECNENGVFKFMSVGEKHFCVWTLANGKLTSENGKLGQQKNKNVLAVTQSVCLFELSFALRLDNLGFYISS